MLGQSRGVGSILAGAVGGVVLLLLLVAAAPAVAGPGLYITLHNNLDRAVRLQEHGGSDCWDAAGLAGDGTTAAAHSTAQL